MEYETQQELRQAAGVIVQTMIEHILIVHILTVRILIVHMLTVHIIKMVHILIVDIKIVHRKIVSIKVMNILIVHSMTVDVMMVHLKVVPITLVHIKAGEPLMGRRVPLGLVHFRRSCMWICSTEQQYTPGYTIHYDSRTATAPSRGCTTGWNLLNICLAKKTSILPLRLIPASLSHPNSHVGRKLRGRSRRP